jgi:ribosomal protein L7/L12
MKRTELNSELIETHLCARALALAVRGHFGAATEGDGEALESLALHCVKKLDALIHKSALVTVVLTSAGDRMIDVIKEVRSSMGLSLTEAKDLVVAAPTTLKEAVTKAEADAIKNALEAVGGACVVLT